MMNMWDSLKWDSAKSKVGPMFGRVSLCELGSNFENFEAHWLPKFVPYRNCYVLNQRTSRCVLHLYMGWTKDVGNTLVKTGENPVVKMKKTVPLTAISWGYNNFYMADNTSIDFWTIIFVKCIFSWAKNAGFRMNEIRSKPHLYTYTYNIIHRYIYICTNICINYCIILYYFELYTTISPLHRHCISSISPLIWTPDFYLAWLIHQWVPPGWECAPCVYQLPPWLPAVKTPGGRRLCLRNGWFARLHQSLIESIWIHLSWELYDIMDIFFTQNGHGYIYIYYYKQNLRSNQQK